MNQKPLRIVFMGTPEFAAKALERIDNGPHDVVCTYTQPPRPKGRGHKLQKSAVHEYADNNSIPVYHPKSLKNAEQQEVFASHNADVAIVAAYGLILPLAVLDAPKHGCINIHASLLPRWRGASPLQRAIWSGDAKSGVTLMQMDEGLDTGPEIMKRSCDIGDETTVQTLHDELAEMGAEMIAETLNILHHDGALNSTAQDNSQTTYAPLLKKEDGAIHWGHTAQEIDRQIRALNPWPGTYTSEGENRLKIHSAKIADIIADKALEIKNQSVGMLLDASGTVLCGGNTYIKVDSIQPAGKKRMDVRAALNGGYIEIGQIL